MLFGHVINIGHPLFILPWGRHTLVQGTVLECLCPPAVTGSLSIPSILILGMEADSAGPLSAMALTAGL